jgi:hypothetical protein
VRVAAPEAVALGRHGRELGGSQGVLLLRARRAAVAGVANAKTEFCLPLGVLLLFYSERMKGDELMILHLLLREVGPPVACIFGILIWALFSSS